MKKLLLASAIASALTIGFSTSVMAASLVDTLAADGSFKTLLSAIKTAGLEDKLKAASPLTLFAPNDAAFAKLPKAKLDELLSNKQELSKVLSYHLVAGPIAKADVDAGKIKTVEGEDLKLSITNGVKVNNVAVVGQELRGDNGSIHIVSSVLMPAK
jgi:uncharacterized surface protein with fasciclin (FAS1) repeats